MKARFSTAIAIAFLAAATASTALQAKVRPAEVAINSTSVNYADLNLGNPADMEVLHQRVQKAADRMCRSKDDRSARQLLASRQCAERAVARAMDQVSYEGYASIN